MPWELLWSKGTRELVEAGARQMFASLSSKSDIGVLVVEKVEEEVRLHPLPSPHLPQFSREEVLNLGRMQIFYHIDSVAGRAEIRRVTVF